MRIAVSLLLFIWLAVATAIILWPWWMLTTAGAMLGVEVLLIAGHVLRRKRLDWPRARVR